jgi:hypothetical protein
MIFKLKDIWKSWKVLMEKVGTFQAKIVFSTLYFLLVTPMGVIANLFGDFFRVRSSPKWEKVEDRWSTFAKLKEQ